MLDVDDEVNFVQDVGDTLVATTLSIVKSIEMGVERGSNIKYQSIGDYSNDSRV